MTNNTKRKRTISFDKSICVPRLNLNNLAINNSNKELDIMIIQMKLDKVNLREKKNRLMH